MTPAVVIGIAAIVTVATAAIGWYRWMGSRKREQEKQEQQRGIEELIRRGIPPNAIYVNSTSTERRVQSSLRGAFLLVGVGTYGQNQVRKFLILAARCGLEELVGTILLLENDAVLRDQFRRNIPTVFQDRVIEGYSDAFAGGFANRDIDYALRKVRVWGPSIDEAARAAIDHYLRHNESRDPALVLWFQSLGGQAAIGIPAMARISDRFEESLIVGFVSLPRHTDLRNRFVRIKRELELRRLFVWTLSDDLGPDPVTIDYGMVALPLALADSALYGDQATQVNNVFSLAAARAPGSILRYDVWASEVVAERWQPDPNRPPKYYVYRIPILERMSKGLEALAAGQGLPSAALPMIDRRRVTFDVIMASIYHNDLQQVYEQVVKGRELERATFAVSGNGHRPLGELFGEANYETACASIGTEINDEKPTCPVIAVRLAVIPYGAELVGEIVKPPMMRAFDAARQQLDDEQQERRENQAEDEPSTTADGAAR